MQCIQMLSHNTLQIIKYGVIDIHHNRIVIIPILQIKYRVFNDGSTGIVSMNKKYYMHLPLFENWLCYLIELK